MLETIRESSKSTLVWVAFGAIIIVFIFFFGPQSSGFSAGGRTWAARIDGTTFFDTQITAAYERGRQLTGQSGSLSDAEFVQRRREIMEDYALTYALASRAEDIGLEIGGDALNCYIVNWNPNYMVDDEFPCRSFPAHYPTRFLNQDFGFYQERDGSFSSSYRQEVQGRFQMSVDEYEAYKAVELLALMYVDMLAAAVPVAPGLVESTYRRREDTVSLEFIELDPRAVGSVTATDSQIDQALVARADELQATYNEQIETFTSEREIRVRWLRLRKGEGEEATAASLERFNDLTARAEGGEDFEALVREHSDFAPDRESGGDTGLRVQGALTNEVYVAANDLSIGDIGTAEVSSLYIIFRLEEVVESAVTPFEEVSRDLASSLLTAELTEDAQAGLAERGNRILELLASHDSLQDAAAAEAVERSAAMAPTDIVPTPNEDTPPEDAPENDETGDEPGDEPIDEIVEEAPGVAMLIASTTPPFARERGIGNPARIPSIGESRELARIAFELTEEAPVHPTLIDVEGTQYIVRLAERVVADDMDADSYAQLYNDLQRSLAEELVGPLAVRARITRHAYFPLGPVAQSILEDFMERGEVRYNEDLLRIAPLEEPPIQ